MMKNRTIFRAAVTSAVSLAGLAVASPAAACPQTLQVRFWPDATEIADKEGIARFMSVPGYGARQRVIVRVSGPVHDLARRRALALASLLQAEGLLPSGIMIESNKSPQERAAIIAYPPPTALPDPHLAQSAPPAPARRTCGG